MYKFNEGENIDKFSGYVDSTYEGHYAQGKIQTTEVIIDDGIGMAFCLGNAFKYLRRYGKKNGYNKKDLYKAMHYILISIFLHDNEIDNKEK